MSLANATKSPPFSNGTEGYCWMEAWCDYCAHDHAMHSADGEGGCPIVAESMLACFDDYPEAWPEAWLPEPDDGQRFLPSRMVCLHFTPCEPCGGDPGATERAARIAEVQAYWKGQA